MADEISLEITETITKVEVTEDVTSINITPNITSVELKGISISNAGSATAMSYAGENNTLGHGSTVADSLDHINTNGLNKNADNTIDGNTTIAYDHTLNFTSGTPVYNAMNLGNNNITGVNHIAFADAGAGEGLRWQNIEIVETNDALTANSPGDLQVTYKQADNSYARRFTVRDTGVDVVGITTSTSFSGPLTGSVTGDLTGNVTGGTVTATSFSGPLTGNVTGQVSDISNHSTDDLTEGTNNLYYTDAKADARVNLQTGSNLDLSQKTTTELAEGDNEYYTDARVNDKLGSGVDNIVTTGYLRGPSTFTIDPAGHGDNTGKVVIAGDLQVDGTTTTINSTELTIDDKIIEVASNATNIGEANGAGLSVGGTSATLTYTSSFDGWTFNKSIDLNGNLLLSGGFFDSNNSNGTTGQALLSTGTATEWGDISTTLNVEADSGDTQAIAMLTETLDISGGTGISTATTDNTVTVTLDNTAVTAGTYGAAETIPQITVDDQGRITSVNNLTGNSGPRGAHAAATFDYMFSMNDSDYTPSKFLSLSSYDYTASDLRLSVNYTDNNSNDLTDLIKEVTTVNSHITLINNEDPEKFLILKITDAHRDTSYGAGQYESLVVSVERVAGVLGSTSGTSYQKIVAGLTVGDGTDLPSQPYITAAFNKAGELAALPASTLSYTNNYDTVLGTTQHVSGGIAFNNWDYEAATSMSLSKTDSNSKDVEDLIEHLLGGNGLPIKALITITNQLHPSKYVTFEVDTVSGFNSELSDFLTVAIDYKSGITGKDSNGDTTDAAGLIPLYGVGPGPLAVSILRLPNRATIDTTGIVYGVRYSNDLTETLPSGQIAFSSHSYTDNNLQIKLHSTSNESSSVKDFIRNSATSNATPKGHLRLTSLVDNDHALFEIDGIADSTSNDYTTLNLTHISGSTGNVALTTKDLVVVSLQNAADVGAQGEPGAMPGASFEYGHSQLMGQANFSAGTIQFNHWNYDYASTLKISSTDNDSVNIKDTIRFLTGAAGVPKKGYVTVTNKANPSRYVVFEIEGLHESGSTDISDNDFTTIDIKRVAGITGTNDEGETGTVGPLYGLGGGPLVVSFSRAADAAPADPTALTYKFSTQNTMDSGDRLKLSVSNYYTGANASNLRVYLPSTDINSLSAKDFIRHMAGSDATSKGYIRLSNIYKPGDLTTFEITGIADQSDDAYTVLNITHVFGKDGTAQTGGVATHNEYVQVTFLRAADNGDIDAHLNVSGASNGEVLSWNGSDYAWVAQAGGGSVRAVGVDTDGDGTTDNTLESSEDLVLKAGTNVTLAEADGVVTVNSSGGGSVRAVGVDTNGDGTTNNTLESSEDLVLKAGTNVTLAEAGGVVTVNSPTPADVLVDSDFSSSYSGFLKRGPVAGNYSVDTTSYLSTGGGVVLGNLTIGSFVESGTLGVLGDINVSGTVDGVDISTRDGVLTTTTTTANNALPKAGGQMTGNITFSGTETVDGRDLSADGARLDTIPYHRVRHERLRFTAASVTLTTSYQNISQTPEIYSPSTPVKCSRYIEFQTEIEWRYINANNNDLRFKLEVTVPTSSATVTTLGTATTGTFSGYSTGNYENWMYVSGDVTHHLTAFGRMNKTGVSGATEAMARSWHYDPVNNRTYILTESNPGFSFNTGDTVYWHPYAWESAGTTLYVEDTLSERYVGTGSRQNITLRFKTTYDDNQLKYKAYLREIASTDSAIARSCEAILTEVGEV